MLPPPSASSLSASRVGRAAAVLAAAMLALLPMLVRPPEDQHPVTEMPDGGTPQEQEGPAVLADASTLDPYAVASLSVPERPPEWQETHCDPKRREVSINGGCYKEQASGPPCAEGEFDHGGKCWAAVAKRAKPANALGEVLK